MKRFVRYFLILILAFVVLKGNANPLVDKLQCKFYEAFVTGDMGEWPDWMNMLEEEYNKSGDQDLLYELVLAHYGYVAYLIGIESEEKAKKYLEKGNKYNEILSRSEYYKSHAQAFKGAFLGYEIGMNKAKAVFLGPKSMKHINKAVDMNPYNPNVWVEKGNATFHIPKMFQGSFSEAARYFEKAIEYFEVSEEKTKCNWLYLNSLAWLARSYDKAKNVKKAYDTYQKILRIEPGFSWVKNELYPEFTKDHNIRKLSEKE
jgi:tetratricopeptide (TPR) repeat protein